MSKALLHQKPNCIPMTTSKELRQGKEIRPSLFAPLAKTLTRLLVTCDVKFWIDNFSNHIDNWMNTLIQKMANYQHYAGKDLLTVAKGLIIVLINAWDALVVERMVSVLPYLNHLVPPLSYIAVVWPYNLKNL